MRQKQGGNKNVIALVWTTPEDYPRFLEVCGRDDYPETFPKFVEQVTRKLLVRGLTLADVERVIVDPYAMRDWCLRHHGKVDRDARAAYVVTQVRERNGEGPSSLN